MRVLIKEKLSPNKYKTPEGYLVCVDAILARTGKQQYRKNELYVDSDDDSIVDVDRPYDEVFSEQTIASFENKPFVNEHPNEDVNVHNHKDYAVGFVRDVHKGEVDGEPVLLGNLIITDEETIAEIESGEKTELSCGYDCDITDDENPCQRNIRGNHVALCKAGRAGIARIQDSKIKDDILVEGKTYITKSGAKLKVKKVIAGYSEFNGKPFVEIHYDFVSASGKKSGSSKCYAEDFFEMMTNPKLTGDSIKDSSEDDFYDELFSSNLKYEFIKGGYGIKFKTPRDYQKAKEIAKRTHYTKGKWYDKDLEFFEYGGTTISNEDSVADSNWYAVYGEESGYMKEFKTLSEAKKFIKETQRFDKRNGIEDEYYIEVEVHDSIKDVNIQNRKTRLLKTFKQYNYNRDDAIAEVNNIKNINEDEIAELTDWIYTIYKDFNTLKDSIEDAGTTRRMFRESEVGDENSWFGTTDWGTPKGSMYIYEKNGKIIAEGSSSGWSGNALEKGEKKEFNSVKDLNKWLNTPVEDSIKDSDFKYLSEEAKKLKEELGLYKKQIGIHTTTNKKEYSPRQNQYNNKLVKELNESINEAIDNLSKGIYTPSAWHRLSQHLETWSGEPELEKICNKANSAIKKFIKYLETKGKDSMEEIVKDKLQNKPVKVRIKFESNQEANDALKMLCKKEQFIDCDLIFDDTVEVKTTDAYVDDLKKALKLYFVKKIEVKDSIKDDNYDNLEAYLKTVGADDRAYSIYKEASRTSLFGFKKFAQVNGGVYKKIDVEKAWNIVNGKVKDSEELVEDGRLIEPEQKYVKEFERMIQRAGFKIDKTGKTISGRLHYQVITNQKGYDEKDLKQFSRELEKIANTMRGFEIPMTYDVGLQYDTYISAGIDLDKQYVKDSVEDTNCKDEAIYKWMADPEDEQDLIDEAKKLGCQLQKIGSLIQVTGPISKLAKVLGETEESIIKASQQRMSTIKKVKDVDTHKEVTQELEKETKKLDSIKVLKLIDIAKKAKLVKDRKSPWDVKVGDIITHARLANGTRKYKVLKVEYEFPGRPEHVWVRLLETPDLKYSDDPYAFRPVGAMVSGDLTILDSIKDSKVEDGNLDFIIYSNPKGVSEEREDEVVAILKKYGSVKHTMISGMNKFTLNSDVNTLNKAFKELSDKKLIAKLSNGAGFVVKADIRDSEIKDSLDKTYKPGQKVKISNGFTLGREEVIVKKDTGAYILTEDGRKINKAAIQDSKVKDSVYKIKTFNNKWYYEETREDGYSNLVGPFKTSAEARAALQKHRPNVKVRHLESGTYYDAMELSAKTSEELDNLMKQYQKKHPTWKFGEIKKDKGLYKCSVVKD